MFNSDNKTKIIDDFNLLNYKELIENNPCHIATVNSNKEPNLSVASDIKILDKNIILISNNEMINTPDNILSNENIVITSFNDKWAGLRLTGKQSIILVVSILIFVIPILIMKLRHLKEQ